MTALVSLALLIVTFAVVLVVHLFAALAIGRTSAANGLIAFLLPPLLPYLAARQRRWRWLTVWCVAVVGYGTAVWVAHS